jgi:hypothetical protein
MTHAPTSWTIGSKPSEKTGPRREAINEQALWGIAFTDGFRDVQDRRLL